VSFGSDIPVMGTETSITVTERPSGKTTKFLRESGVWQAHDLTEKDPLGLGW